MCLISMVVSRKKKRAKKAETKEGFVEGYTTPSESLKNDEGSSKQTCKTLDEGVSYKPGRRLVLRGSVTVAPQEK